MKDKTTVRLIAEVLAGLQVPVSLGKHLIGTAYEPWSELHDRLAGFGWSDADKYEKALREAIVAEALPTQL